MSTEEFYKKYIDERNAKLQELLQQTVTCDLPPKEHMKNYDLDVKDCGIVYHADKPPLCSPKKYEECKRKR